MLHIMRRLRLTLPDNLLKFIHHDEDKYAKWEELYTCVFTAPDGYPWHCSNGKPTTTQPAVIPVIPRVPLSDIWCDELCHMSDQNHWDTAMSIPLFSKELFLKFLARVHAFTSFG